MSEVKVHLEKDNQVVIVLPDDTVIYTTAEALLTLSAGKSNPVCQSPVDQSPKYPASKKPFIPVPESHRIFCPSDRKILSYLSKNEIDKLERFMEDHRHLTLWANKSVPKMRTAYGLNPDKLPIRGQVFCYVDCYGRVYSSLDAVAEFYQVETIGGPLTSFANYAAKYADKIRIPEFNSDKNANIFWHLNFKDHRGQKVSIIKMYRCSLYEWEKDDKFDCSIFYSRRIHQFAEYAITVMHAREHINDDN